MKNGNNLYVRSATPRKKSSGGNHSSGLTLLVLAVVLGALTIALSKVYLERRTFQAGLEWEATTQELNETLKENDNLHIERERLTSGDYILPQARRMGLRPPVPGQIRRVWPDESGETVVAHSP